MKDEIANLRDPAMGGKASMNEASPILNAESCLDLGRFLIVSPRDGYDSYLYPFIMRLISGEQHPLWLEISTLVGVHQSWHSMSPHQTLSEYLQLPYTTILWGGRRYHTSIARAVDHVGPLAFVKLDSGNYLWTRVPKESL